MANTSDIKNGLTIELNGKLFQVVYFQHVKPGKGAAFVRTKLKNLENGKVIENTFPSGAKINEIRIERRPYQFLYKDDLGFHFMHLETYEQIALNQYLIDNYDLLKEGQEVEIVFHADNETPLTCELPPFVEMEVTYTEPGLKGDTANSALKPATIETDATIMVPLFINTGDKIKVDTRSRAYSERVR
ncbi:MAG: elongation factor P [Bacteroidales bacterium]|jgi:elongation factor P|nr:elongation factor P [Bacteroidales bacterium]MDD4234569.1 elongation factor P [Bacteroidales bacterium]MDY0160589.1 elongation factor P [Bacteroidales bacterium]